MLWGTEFEPGALTGGLERMWCTKTHGHPQSRKPVARRRGHFIGEVVPPAGMVGDGGQRLV